jgi:hypothetical protein
MALEGTLDSFPLADVLRFLAGGERTGVLQVDGDRGTVRLWLEDGECTGAEAAGTVVDDAVRATFEALRCVTGSFRFEEDRRPAVAAAQPRPVSVVLAEALALRAEWDAVEQVLPSSRHRVRPVPSPPDGRVVLDPLGWSIVTSLGRSDDVASVVARSGAGELDASRALVALVREGLLVVESPEPVVASVVEVVDRLPSEPSADTVPIRSSAHARDDVPTPTVAASPVHGDVTAASPVHGDVTAGEAVAPADPFRPLEDLFPIDDLVGLDEVADPWAAGPAAGGSGPTEAPPAASAASPPGAVEDETSSLSDDVADAIAEVLGAGGGPVTPGPTYEGGDPAFR